MARKDAGLRIRVERNLRDEFLEVCRSQDKPAAQVIREFMRAYVARPALTDSSESTKGHSRRLTHVEGGTVGKKRHYRRSDIDT
jgi:hypothetical protein